MSAAIELRTTTKILRREKITAPPRRPLTNQE
jgi:hypothetical protein